MNDLHLKIYNYMKRNTKIQPRDILTNAIFALSFSSSAIEMMAHFSPHTCLKNSACLIIVFFPSFFFSPGFIGKSLSISCGLSEKISVAANGYPNLQKLLMRKKTKQNLENNNKEQASK